MKTLLALLLLCSLHQLSAQNNLDTIAYNLGTELEKAYDEANATFISDVFQDSVFLSKFLLGNMGKKEITIVNKEFLKADFGQLFSKEIFKAIEQSHYYNFINFYNDAANNYYLVFRLFGDTGLNYHEYVLEFVDEETYYISDIFIYLTGEYLSETYEGIYNQMISQFIIKDPSEENPYDVEALLEIGEIKRLMGEGLNDAALYRYDNNLPERTKQEKVAMMIELQLVDPSDTVRYQNLIDRLYQVSDNVAAIHLINIDRYYLTGDYPKALHTIDSIDYYIADDFLDYFRGNIHLTSGDFVQAEKCYQKLVANYPYLPEVYDNFLTLYYYQEQYPKMLSTLDSAIENLELELDTVKEYLATDFPNFHQSDLYQEWLKKRD